MNNSKKNIGVLGAFALSVGTSIGWGSFVVTGSNYLSKAGLIGSIAGIAAGMLLMFIIAYNYYFMINQTTDSGGICCDNFYTVEKFTFFVDNKDDNKR